jgi:cytochrome b
MIKPRAVAFHLLLLWHGLLAGGYTVAFLTAEGSHALHEFAGYLVLGLLVLRLVVASLVSGEGSWALPWPGRALWRSFLSRLRSSELEVFRQRTPLVPLSAFAILATLVFAAVTGLAADAWRWEDLHEGIAEATLTLVLFHLGLVSLAPLLKKASGGSSRASELQEG